MVTAVPQSLSLAGDVHAVAVGADLVVLDVAADAYLCLVGAASVVQLQADGGVVIDDLQVRATLLDAGLIRIGAGRGPDRYAPRPSRGPPIAAPDMTPAPADLLRLMRAGLTTEWAFGRQSFAQILAWARERPGRAKTMAASAELLAAAAIFARARVWAPFDGACLKRSYMMLRYLRLCGHDADWVIGVRTWPFVAHCWLQVGDQVLDEDVERLAAYQPILVA